MRWRGTLTICAVAQAGSQAPAILRLQTSRRRAFPRGLPKAVPVHIVGPYLFPVLSSMKIRPWPFVFPALALAVVCAAGCGKGEKQPAQEIAREPKSLVVPESQLLPKAPEPQPEEEETLAALSEDGPLTLVDVENAVREVADMAAAGQLHHGEAARTLRRSATAMTYLMASASDAEKSRLETLSYHLGAVAGLLERRDAKSTEQALGQLKGLMQMYMP